MRALMVVETQERVETSLQGRPTGEVAPTEGHAPVLLQDGDLQSLHEAISPGMARLRARVAQTELAAGRIERAMEFGSPIGQHAAQPPAGATIVRPEDRPQEVRRGLGRVGRQQPGHAVGAGSIARRDLPDLAHALELPNIEGVQTHQLARLAGLDVARVPMPRAPELLPGPLGQQPRGLQSVMLEDRQALPSGSQAGPPQRPLHRTGGHAHLPASTHVAGNPAGAPRRGAHGHAQPQAFRFRGQLHWATGPRPMSTGMDAVLAIAFQSLLPAVEQRAGDPRLPARLTDIAQHLGAPDDMQTQSVYLFLEGHRSILPKWSLAGGCHSGNDRPDGPHCFSSQVSTLFRL